MGLMHLVGSSIYFFILKKTRLLIEKWQTGQVADLNLEYLGSCGVDYYSGNLHKWGMAPRACAVLWCPPELQDVTYPNNTSHYHYLTYQDRFFEQVRWYN